MSVDIRSVDVLIPPGGYDSIIGAIKLQILVTHSEAYNINRKWKIRQKNVGKIESTRTKTETNCYGNEGKMKFETIDGGFAHEVLNAWFSYAMKELCNSLLKNIWFTPIVFLSITSLGLSNCACFWSVYV